MPLPFRNILCTTVMIAGVSLCTGTATFAGPNGPNMSPSIRPISPHMAPSIHFSQPLRSQSLDRAEQTKRLHKKARKKSTRVKNAPSVKNKSVAIEKPKTNTGNPALSSQEAAQAARALNNLQQLRDAQKAHDVFGGGGSASDPAAGTALAGHGLSLDHNGNDENNAINHANWTRDCLANPANCLFSHSPGAGASGGMMSGPPTAIPGGIDRREQASDDWEGPGGGTWSDWVADHGEVTETTHSQDNEGYHVHQRFEDGTRVSYSFNKDGTSNQRIINSHGRVISRFTFDKDGNRTTHLSTVTIRANDPVGGQEGAGVGAEAGNPSGEHEGNEAEGGESTGNGPAEQPGSNDSSTGKADPCGWTPWGCRSTRDVRTSIKQMTSQPAQGESGGTGTGSGAPRLGSEAVTNSGDSSWSPQTGGTGGGGHPIDMRDPVPRGPEGVPGPHN